MKATEATDVAVPAIIERCRSGDISALRRIVEIHQSYAYSLAFRMLRNEEHAKDIVQEAFIRVWRNIGTYQTSIKFTTWLYKIVINLCYDCMRTEARKRKLFGLFDVLRDKGETSTAESLLEQIEKKDTAAIVLAIAKKLPPKQKLIFTLRDVQDFTLEEICELTDISMSSVKANLSYARQHIRKTYKAMENRGDK